jgi:hypothetical protein
MMAFLEPAKDPESHPVNKLPSMGFPIKAVDHFESIRSVLLASVSGCSAGYRRRISIGWSDIGSRNRKA